MIRVLRDMLRVLNLPCREHTVLMSRQLDTPLSRGEAIGVRIHVIYCLACRRFLKQLRQLQSLGRSLADQLDTGSLPDDVRQRLRSSIGNPPKKS
ncbi:MAG: hypothetical protein U0638_06565 [Phycisphaerales bacterium]